MIIFTGKMPIIIIIKLMTCLVLIVNGAMTATAVVTIRSNTTTTDNNATTVTSTMKNIIVTPSPPNDLLRQEIYTMLEQDMAKFTDSLLATFNMPRALRNTMMIAFTPLIKMVVNNYTEAYSDQALLNQLNIQLKSQIAAFINRMTSKVSRTSPFGLFSSDLSRLLINNNQQTSTLKPLTRKRHRRHQQSSSSLDELFLSVTTDSWKIDENSDVYKAVKQIFIDQVMKIYAQAGMEVAESDLDMTVLGSFINDIAMVANYTARLKNDPEMLDHVKIRRQVDAVVGQLLVAGAFDKAWGNDGLSFDIYDLIRLSMIGGPFDDVDAADFMANSVVFDNNNNNNNKKTLMSNTQIGDVRNVAISIKQLPHQQKYLIILLALMTASATTIVTLFVL